MSRRIENLFCANGAAVIRRSISEIKNKKRRCNGRRRYEKTSSERLPGINRGTSLAYTRAPVEIRKKSSGLSANFRA